MNTSYTPGLRTIKTAFSVFVCLIVSNIFNRPDGFFSSIAAIICIQQTYDKTFKKGIDRFVGTLLGGAVGYFLLKVLKFFSFDNSWAYVVVVPLSVVLITYVLNLMGETGSVVIGSIVMISVILKKENSGTDALWYVVNRVIDTSLGIMIAMFVNKFFLPKKEN